MTAASSDYSTSEPINRDARAPDTLLLTEEQVACIEAEWSELSPYHMRDYTMRVIADWRTLRAQIQLLTRERDAAVSEFKGMSGRVLCAIRERFRLSNHQTTASLIESVGAASPKQVNNALGYLTRKGQIERIGYGQYRAVASAAREICD